MKLLMIEHIYDMIEKRYLFNEIEAELHNKMIFTKRS